MTRHRGWVILGLGAAIIALLAGSAARGTLLPRERADSSTSAVEGAFAPELTLTDLQGEEWTLGGLRGKVVLLNFWATWCAFCRGERSVLQQVHEDYADRGVVVITVAVGEEQDHLRGFAGEHNLTLPILADEDGRAARSYAVRGIPASFFIDGEGVIRVQHVGALSRGLIEEYLEQVL